MTLQLIHTLAPDTRGAVMVAFDTSLGSSVACCAGGEVWEAHSENPRGHAEVVAQLLRLVLDESQQPPTAVEHVVAGIGPGLFTGLRVGIAAAEAFALGAGASIGGMLSPEAAAFTSLEAHPTAQVTVLQDAKRRELFRTVFTGFDEHGTPQITGAPSVIHASQHEESDSDLWPQRISTTSMLTIAARRRLAGVPPVLPRAQYLRQPDVKTPNAPKRVST